MRPLRDTLKTSVPVRVSLRVPSVLSPLPYLAPLPQTLILLSSSISPLYSLQLPPFFPPTLSPPPCLTFLHLTLTRLSSPPTSAVPLPGPSPTSLPVSPFPSFTPSSSPKLYTLILSPPLSSLSSPVPFPSPLPPSRPPSPMASRFELSLTCTHLSASHCEAVVVLGPNQCSFCFTFKYRRTFWG